MRPILGEILGVHLCYADDICLISLSSARMQQLLNICDTYDKEYDCIMVVNHILYVLNPNVLYLTDLFLH